MLLFQCRRVSAKKPLLLFIVISFLIAYNKNIGQAVAPPIIFKGGLSDSASIDTSLIFTK